LSHQQARKRRFGAQDRDQYRQAAGAIAPNVTRISLMSAFGGKADPEHTFKISLHICEGGCASDAIHDVVAELEAKAECA
jgi:hypothetical protein